MFRSKNNRWALTLANRNRSLRTKPMPLQKTHLQLWHMSEHTRHASSIIFTYSIYIRLVSAEILTVANHRVPRCQSEGPYTWLASMLVTLVQIVVMNISVCHCTDHSSVKIKTWCKRGLIQGQPKVFWDCFFFFTFTFMHLTFKIQIWSVHAFTGTESMTLQSLVISSKFKYNIFSLLEAALRIFLPVSYLKHPWRSTLASRLSHLKEPWMSHTMCCTWSLTHALNHSYIQCTDLNIWPLHWGTIHSRGEAVHRGQRSTEKWKRWCNRAAVPSLNGPQPRSEEAQLTACNRPTIHLQLHWQANTNHSHSMLQRYNWWCVSDVVSV